jgi:hypothetical protein
MCLHLGWGKTNPYQRSMACTKKYSVRKVNEELRSAVAEESGTYTVRQTLLQLRAGRGNILLGDERRRKCKRCNKDGDDLHDRRGK